MSREFGEALERALIDRVTLGSGRKPDTETYSVTLHDLRAALQSITPGAGELPRTGAYGEGATCKHGVHPYECVLGCHPDMAAEVSRLREWEKWGREHAKPALEHYNQFDAPDDSVAAAALAALPAMPTRGE